MLLLALVTRLLVGAGVHNTAFRLLAGSLSVMLVGDVGFAVLAEADAYTPNNMINITWLLAYNLRPARRPRRQGPLPGQRGWPEPGPGGRRPHRPQPAAIMAAWVGA